ncbi:MAG: hypothetical protein G3M70_02235 [Candidatus Nitronauta litoralis]|uniref:Uncharacterized protein n=1 Tax=Candidatus Nitronauta litoralis TaxID=2705533 RepID=A0A7T0FYZ2_9BACT|nr:MAG: hypothetical protein G3M70_02235 [Candidatus Nitronauta litoralis]
MEFVLVKFAGRRRVLVDDEGMGYNRDESGQEQVLEIPGGVHSVRLGGLHDYLPLAHDVDINQTTRDNPLVLEFSSTSCSSQPAEEI